MTQVVADRVRLNHRWPPRHTSVPRALGRAAALLTALGLSAGCGVDETRHCPGPEAGTLSIMTQAELDAAANYVCAQNLQLEGSALAYVDELTTLRKVWGWVSIRGNGALRDLNGLRNLEQIGLSLRIEDNAALSSIQGLGRLSSLGSDDAFEVDDEGTSPMLALSIRNDDSLRSFAGLEGLEHIAGDVRIEGNDSLTGLAGLSRLEEVTGSLRFAKNYGLVNLDGLESLRRVGGALDLTELQLLRNTRSLTSLTVVGGDFTISAAPQLASASLPLLETVDGALSLQSLPLLKELDLPALRRAKRLELTHLNGLEAFPSLPQLERLPDGWLMEELPQLLAVGALPRLEELGAVSFWSLAQLESLPSAPRLTRIGGRCDFVSLPALRRLDGFGTLTEVAGTLFVASNASLEGLDWAAVRLVQGDLEVENNGALPAAEAQAFAARVAVVGETSLCGNAAAPACDAP